MSNNSNIFWITPTSPNCKISLFQPRPSGPQALNKPGTVGLRKELYKCGAKNQKQFSLEDTKQLFKANAAVVLVATAVVAVVVVHVLIVVVDGVAVLDVNLVVTSKVDFLTQS